MRRACAIWTTWRDGSPNWKSAARATRTPYERIQSFDPPARGRRAHRRDPAAPVPLPAGGSRGGTGSGQAHHGDQERHLQRTLLPGPFPRSSGDAGRADRGGAGADFGAADRVVGRGRARREVVLPRQGGQGALQPAGGPGRSTAARSAVETHDPKHGPVHRPRPGRWRGSRQLRTDVRGTRRVSVHPTAIVDPGARLAADVAVGPYSVIGADVVIGEGSSVGAHALIEGPTRIGLRNRIGAYAAIGGDPQDKKYHGERSELLIGNDNTIREFVTINRGTGDGGSVTRIGDDNWIMAYVHVAHDCLVGDHAVLANNATLAGHVEIGDHVVLGGFCGVHQFCKIGAHAFAAMFAAINRDVPPFVYAAGQFAQPRGVNSEGLKRRGFSAKRIAAIKRAYRTLYMSGKTLAEARAELAVQAGMSEDVRALVDFIDRSERHLVR
ncbi:MAG: acyl-ACP--UDP-N-acetylglucosamine O-acyltransferase [Proteobacteria bacterium]|nr:acyl-ACP--UDP-N-acetylglucosamine O-acyltransferase [Pseudomonadota bacterium]